MDILGGTYRFITQGRVAEVLFALIFLLAAWSIFTRRTIGTDFGKRFFTAFLVVSVVQLLFVFADTWFEWHRPECGIACRYFFPPYSHYYFNEVIVRWISTLSFNASIGLVGGVLFSLFARLTNGRIIDQLDVDLLTVGGMVAGWPNILLFYGLVFVLTIAMTMVRAIHERSASVRMIITPALPFAAAAIAVFGDQLSQWLRLYEIGVTIV